MRASKVCNGPVANVRASTVIDIVTATSERLANVLPPLVKVGVNTAPFIVCGNAVVISNVCLPRFCALAALISTT